MRQHKITNMYKQWLTSSASTVLGCTFLRLATEKADTQYARSMRIGERYSLHFTSGRSCSCHGRLQLVCTIAFRPRILRGQTKQQKKKKTEQKSGEPSKKPKRQDQSKRKIVYSFIIWRFYRDLRLLKHRYRSDQNYKNQIWKNPQLPTLHTPIVRINGISDWPCNDISGRQSFLEELKQIQIKQHQLQATVYDHAVLDKHQLCWSLPPETTRPGHTNDEHYQ